MRTDLHPPIVIDPIGGPIASSIMLGPQYPEPILEQDIGARATERPPSADAFAPVQIRVMTASDAPAVTRLCPALGYEATPQQIEHRQALTLGRPDNGLVVAQQREAIVVWAPVIGARSLATDGYAEIAGAVVETERLGIGSRLIRAR